MSTLHVKPDFVSGQIIVESLLKMLIVCLVLSQFFVLAMLETGPEDGAVYILISIIYYMVFIIPLLVLVGNYLWTKYTYRSSNYEFKSDRIEFSESFFNQEEKELMYGRIIEVSHKRSILQRMFGTGTIVIQTHATPTRQGSSGLKIPDLFESQKKYREIRSIINNYNSAD